MRLGGVPGERRAYFAEAAHALRIGNRGPEHHRLGS